MKIISQNISFGKIYNRDTQEVVTSSAGLALFVSFTQGDSEEILPKMAKKVLDARVFPDQNGKTNLSLKDIQGEILLIPNFTIYGDIKDSRRPSFTKALAPTEAEDLFNKFNQILKTSDIPIKAGFFGADMQIEVINEGPFSFIFDGDQLWPK